jgi:hypothetical protein
MPATQSIRPAPQLRQPAITGSGAPRKSLIHMFGPSGNLQAGTLFGIIGYLQQQADVELHVTPEPR